MPKYSSSGRKAAGSVHLLDGNVLYALIDEAHVHHGLARQWFSEHSSGFATCPITQGTLVRLAMRLGGQGVEQALALLGMVTAHAKHHFWPDMLPYDQVRCHGVMGHRQVPGWQTGRPVRCSAPARTSRGRSRQRRRSRPRAPRCSRADRSLAARR